MPAREEKKADDIPGGSQASATPGKVTGEEENESLEKRSKLEI